MGMKLLAGDFPRHEGASFMMGAFLLPDPNAGFWRIWPKMLCYQMSDMKSLNEVTESNKVSVLGAAGWGTVGAVALGPVGLLAGMVLGGRGKAVVFAVEFGDGRKALIQCDGKTWSKIIAAQFDA